MSFKIFLICYEKNNCKIGRPKSADAFKYLDFGVVLAIQQIALSSKRDSVLFKLCQKIL